jgi:hypothetical protein
MSVQGGLAVLTAFIERRAGEARVADICEA